MSKVAKGNKVYRDKSECDALVQSLLENDRSSGRTVTWLSHGKREIKMSYYERVAHFRIMQSWWWCNPVTNFVEFYSDTPDWVVALARKYGSFRSRGSERQFKED